MLRRLGTVISPSSGDSSPTIMRKTVVLPAPFGPTSPIFSPGLSWNEASTNRIWLPYCLETLVRAIMGRGRWWTRASKAAGLAAGLLVVAPTGVEPVARGLGIHVGAACMKR